MKVNGHTGTLYYSYEYLACCQAKHHMQCVVVCRKNRPLVFHDAFADGIVPMCLGAQNPPSNLEIEVNAAHVASPVRLWLGKYCVVGLCAVVLSDEENNENQG